jgi:hypothetical protein
VLVRLRALHDGFTITSPPDVFESAVTPTDTTLGAFQSQTSTHLEHRTALRSTRFRSYIYHDHIAVIPWSRRVLRGSLPTQRMHDKGNIDHTFLSRRFEGRHFEDHRRSHSI